MLKLILSKHWLMFFAGLLLGSVVFFPTNQIKEKLFSKISESSQVFLESEDMSFGTGLGLGLSKGGLFALNFSKLRMTSSGKSLECSKATLSPHLSGLFMGKITMGIRCESSKNGALIAKIKASPFWSPKTISAELQFQSFNLATLTDYLEGYPIKGVLMGDLNIDEMPLGETRGLPPLEWKLSLQKTTLPALNSDFISLPEIPLGTMDTTGSIKNNRIKMTPLMLGDNRSPLTANLDIDMTLNALGMPFNGEIKGELKAKPDWESSIKNTLDLGLLFGEPNATGSRRFRKLIQGGPVSLLNPPLPYE